MLSRNIKIKIQKTKVLPVVLYGCETWSFDIKRETYTEAFKKGMLRRMSAP
jgi:hypothetical protein